MFSHYELHQKFFENESELRDCLTLLFPIFEEGTEARFNAGEEINFAQFDSNCAYLIIDGIARVFSGRKLIYYLEQNDLILPACLGNPDSKLIFEFPATTQKIKLDQIYLRCLADYNFFLNWQTYLTIYSQQLHLFLHSTTHDHLDAKAETRSFQAGEAIIIQETSPHEVYTLLNGHAEVFVQDKKVGEILPGEIFGALAATNHIPRSASVIAQSPCVILVLQRENFLALAKTHPETLFKLVEDMGRVIISLNEKILATKK